MISELSVDAPWARLLRGQSAAVITVRPSWDFQPEQARKTLFEQFGTTTLAGFGIDDRGLEVQAAGALTAYLRETQKTSLGHITRLIPYRRADTLALDEMTRRSLELVRTLREGKREGSLLCVIDCSATPMGARQLSEWLTSPLTSPELIAERLEAVEELFNHSVASRRPAELARPVVRPRATGGAGRHRPGDAARPGGPGQDAGDSSQAQGAADGPSLEAAQPARGRPRALPGDPGRDRGRPVRRPAAGRQGRGPDPRRIPSRASTSCAPMPRGASRGSPSFRPSRSAAPESRASRSDTTRSSAITSRSRTPRPRPAAEASRATTSASRRSRTPSGTSRRSSRSTRRRSLRAEERACELEYELFTTLRDRVSAEAPRLIQAGAVLAQLDVLAALAELAARHGYCRPEIVAEPVFEVEAGRHPVLDAILAPGDFVPNDVHWAAMPASILLITGPNMAGKSTYIRQVALIAIMAHLGSFVPAKRARIGVVDRLFARVGATDDLSRSQSTFMVEMSETANILNNATPRAW